MLVWDGIFRVVWGGLDEDPLAGRHGLWAIYGGPFPTEAEAVAEIPEGAVVI